MGTDSVSCMMKLFWSLMPSMHSPISQKLRALSRSSKLFSPGMKSSWHCLQNPTTSTHPCRSSCPWLCSSDKSQAFPLWGKEPVTPRFHESVISLCESSIHSKHRSCTHSATCISGSGSTVTHRTHKFIHSFTVATEHKTQWPELHSTSWVSNRNSLKLPTCFLTQIWQAVFPFCKWFWSAALHNSKQVLCAEGWGSRREGGHVEEDRMNTQTATLFQSSSEFPLAWMKHWRVHGLLHSNTASTGKQICKKKKKQECKNTFFHQAMPRVAWLSQSFPIPSAIKSTSSLKGHLSSLSQHTIQFQGLKNPRNVVSLPHNSSFRTPGRKPCYADGQEMWMLMHGRNKKDNTTWQKLLWLEGQRFQTLV